MSKAIALHKVLKAYDGEVALSELSLSVEAGEIVVVIGPSGCGKSTLIRHIAGLEQPDSGTIERPDDIAMVFQSGSLLPWLTVSENIAFGLSRAQLSPAQIIRKTRLQVEAVGLKKFGTAYPKELSDGQRQRVVLARALVADPSVLVLDEAFSLLDIQSSARLHEDLLSVWELGKMTIIMGSHSIEEAVSLGDRVLLMHQGIIVRSYDLRDMPRPRREQAEAFIHQVQAIRRDFLALGD